MLRFNPRILSLQRAWSLRRAWSAAVLALAVAGGACSTSPISARTDSSVKLAQYHSYQWLTPDDARLLQLTRPEVEWLTEYVTVEQNPQLEARIRPRIEQDLIRQGYARAITEQPDFYVTFYVQNRDKDWVSSWSGRTPSTNGVPVIIFPGLDQEAARAYREGSLYLTFYDARTRRAAWTGTMATTSDDQDFMAGRGVATAVDQLIGEFRHDVG